MKFHKLPKAVALDTDRAEMRAAIGMLKKAGIDARRPSPHQLKLDERTSYYPTKGTLFVDGEAEARSKRGLEALQTWINSPRLDDISLI